MPDGRTGGSARAFELLEPLVKAATVRVHAPADGYGTPGTGPTWGSGFFIAPGWVLTCAHVIGEGVLRCVWRAARSASPSPS